MMAGKPETCPNCDSPKWTIVTLPRARDEPGPHRIRHVARCLACSHQWELAPSTYRPGQSKQG